jgi:hypothetical protein
MKDLVTRLRTWVHAVDAVPASDLMDAAANEITLLRGYRDAAEAGAALANLVVGRLRNGAIDGCETVALSGSGDCPAPDNAAKQDIVTDEGRLT